MFDNVARLPVARIRSMRFQRFFILAAAALLATSGRAQQPAAPVAADSSQRLFAVEYRLGPGWVAARQAHEQPHFSEHSQNLRKLREQGSLVLGARYADKGLIVVAAESEAAVRAMVEQDASIPRVFCFDFAFAYLSR